MTETKKEFIELVTKNQPAKMDTQAAKWFLNRKSRSGFKKWLADFGVPIHKNGKHNEYFTLDLAEALWQEKTQITQPI